MSKDYAALPATETRRSDRAVEDESWFRAFLHSAPVGILATLHDGQPFVNSNLFLYDEQTHSIYTHTARVGRTRANIESEEKVCFTITEMGRLLPADEALEFSVEYAGVVIFGRANVVDDPQEETRILQALLDKYAPHLKAGRDYRPPVEEELKRTSVFRIRIDEWSAKKKEVEADFPGAYWYRDTPMLPSVQTRAFWQGSVLQLQIASHAAAPIRLVESVRAVSGRGLEGDRYYAQSGTFSRTPGTGREVTLMALEDLEAMAQLDDLHLTPEETRRNIITRGVPLSHLVGKTFQLGEVILRGMRLCEPCDTLAKSSGKGDKLLRSMIHRGGLRAEIVSDGIIRLGDRIVPLDEL